MNTRKGCVFSLRDDNKELDYLTVSFDLRSPSSARVFSLGKDTDISKESYSFPCFIFALKGRGTISEKEMEEGEAIFFLEDTPFEKRTKDGFIYFEMPFNKEDCIMTERMNKGEIFKLKELLPYQEDKIINLDLLHTDSSKFALISMAKGTSMDAHKAPGEALLFVLDGKAILTYEGKDFTLTEGDNFSFEKGGMHAISAETDFKFALLLEL